MTALAFAALVAFLVFAFVARQRRLNRQLREHTARINAMLAEMGVPPAPDTARSSKEHDQVDPNPVTKSPYLLEMERQQRERPIGDGLVDPFHPNQDWNGKLL